MSENPIKSNEKPATNPEGEPKRRKNYYVVLGVAKDASKDEIRTAHRALANTLAPDKNPGDDEAPRKFKEMQEAYEILSDEESRGIYDVENIFDLAEKVEKLTDAEKLRFISEEIDTTTKKRIDKTREGKVEIPNVLKMLDVDLDEYLKNKPPITLEEFDEQFNNAKAWKRFPEYKGWRAKFRDLLLEEYERKEKIIEEQATKTTKIDQQTNPEIIIPKAEPAPVSDVSNLTPEQQATLDSKKKQKDGLAEANRNLIEAYRGLEVIKKGADTAPSGSAPVETEAERQRQIAEQHKILAQGDQTLKEILSVDITKDGETSQAKSRPEVAQPTVKAGPASEQLNGTQREYEKLLNGREMYERLLRDEGEKVYHKEHKKRLKEIDKKIQKYEREARYAEEDYIGNKEYYEEEKEKTREALQQERFDKDGNVIIDLNQDSIDRLEAEIDRLDKKANPSLWKQAISFNWWGARHIKDGIKYLSRKFPIATPVAGVVGAAGAVFLAGPLTLVGAVPVVGYGIYRGIKEAGARERGGEKWWLNSVSKAIGWEGTERTYIRESPPQKAVQPKVEERLVEGKDSGTTKRTPSIETLPSKESSDLGVTGGDKPTEGKTEQKLLRDTKEYQSILNNNPVVDEGFDPKKVQKLYFKKLDKSEQDSNDGKRVTEGEESRETRKKSIENFRENINRQKKALADLRLKIEEKIEQDENPSKKVLMDWVEVFAQDYKFTQEQKEAIEQRIDKYYKQRDNADEFIKKYKGSEGELIKKLRKRGEKLTDKEVGKLSISKKGVAIVIEAPARLVGKLLSEDAQESPPRGFFAEATVDGKPVYYVVVINKGVDKEGTLEHELTHAFNNIIFADSPRETRNKLTVAQKKYQKNKTEKNLRNSLREIQGVLLGRVKDEIIAWAKEGKLDEIIENRDYQYFFEKRKKFIPRVLGYLGEKSVYYDYMNEFDINDSQLYKDGLKKFEKDNRGSEDKMSLSEKILTQEYQSFIKSGLEALSDLEKSGEYDLNDSIRSLSSEDLRSWRRVVDGWLKLKGIPTKRGESKEKRKSLKEVKPSGAPEKKPEVKKTVEPTQTPKKPAVVEVKKSEDKKSDLEKELARLKKEVGSDVYWIDMANPKKLIEGLRRWAWGADRELKKRKIDAVKGQLDKLLEKKLEESIKEKEKESQNLARMENPTTPSELVGRIPKLEEIGAMGKQIETTFSEEDIEKQESLRKEISGLQEGLYFLRRSMLKKSEVKKPKQEFVLESVKLEKTINEKKNELNETIKKLGEELIDNDKRAILVQTQEDLEKEIKEKTKELDRLKDEKAEGEAKVVSDKQRAEGERDKGVLENKIKKAKGFSDLRTILKASQVEGLEELMGIIDGLDKMNPESIKNIKENEINEVKRWVEEEVITNDKFFPIKGLKDRFKELVNDKMKELGLGKKPEDNVSKPEPAPVSEAETKGAPVEPVAEGPLKVEILQSIAEIEDQLKRNYFSSSSEKDELLKRKEELKKQLEIE